jgi:hypothetical protein
LRTPKAEPHQGQQWDTQNSDSYGFIDNSHNIGDMSGGGEQFQFQIPPELSADWPWPFDITQGFGTF